MPAIEKSEETYKVHPALFLDLDGTIRYSKNGKFINHPEDIELFEITYFDGEEWATEWPEEMESLPHLIEITLAARQKGSVVPLVESLTVNFVRAQGGEGAGLDILGQTQNAQGNGPGGR